MIKHILVALLATVALSGCSLSEYHGTTSFECIGGEMSRGSDQGVLNEAILDVIVQNSKPKAVDNLFL